MNHEIISGHDAIVQYAKELLADLPLPAGVEIVLPPRSSDEMGGRYLEYVPGQRLSAEFPARQQYANALGIIQGGFLAAMFDNVFGGLGLMVTKKPLTSVNLYVEFLRPVLVGMPIRIDARSEKAGRSLVNATAQARGPNGKAIASASTNFLVLGR